MNKKPGTYEVRYSRVRGIIFGRFSAEIRPLISWAKPPFDTFLTFAKKRAGETDEQIPFDCLGACFAVIVPRFAARPKTHGSHRVG